MSDDYKYQIQPLPPASIPGSDVIGPSQYGNAPVEPGSAVSFPTTGPKGPGGGGGGGGDPVNLPTVDLELCTGDTARVYGYILAP